MYNNVGGLQMGRAIASEQDDPCGRPIHINLRKTHLMLWGRGRGRRTVLSCWGQRSISRPKEPDPSLRLRVTLWSSLGWCVLDDRKGRPYYTRLALHVREAGVGGVVWYGRPLRCYS